MGADARRRHRRPHLRRRPRPARPPPPDHREADEAIDDGDPAEIWDEFEPWLYRRVAEDVVNSFRFLQTRAEELSERVAEHFADRLGAAVAFRPDLGAAGSSLPTPRKRTLGRVRHR